MKNKTNETWMRQIRHGWDKQDTDNHTNETWTSEIRQIRRVLDKTK